MFSKSAQQWHSDNPVFQAFKESGTNIMLFPAATLGHCFFPPLSFLLVVWRSDPTWHLLKNNALHHSEDDPTAKQTSSCLSKSLFCAETI